MLYAVFNNHNKVVKALIGLECNINITDKFHRTALHWACRFNNVKIAEIFLDEEMKPPMSLDLTDSDMNVPADVAKHYNHYQIEKMIIKCELRRIAIIDEKNAEKKAKDAARAAAKKA